ncbi:MAG: hypothetical protein RL042_1937 [Nitrospirota bacterium]
MMSYQRSAYGSGRVKRNGQPLIPSVAPFSPAQPISPAYGLLRLVCQSIQDRLKLQACRFQRLLIGIARNPDGGAPEIEAAGPWIRDHEPIPAREEFFFEQQKANGTIGRPVAFANCTTPSFATWRGPLGPSGVTTRSAPDRPRRINSRSASAPPLVLDPRTARWPNREMMRAMISPSWCWLINTLTSIPRRSSSSATMSCCACQNERMICPPWRYRASTGS